MNIKPYKSEFLHCVSNFLTYLDVPFQLIKERVYKLMPIIYMKD